MKQFKCKHCNNIREITFWQEVSHPHLFGVWLYLKCPKCGKKSWFKRVKKVK